MREISITKRILSMLIACTVLVLIILAGGQESRQQADAASDTGAPAPEQETSTVTIAGEELAEMELFVHSLACTEEDEAFVVTDEELAAEFKEITAAAEGYRLVLSYEKEAAEAPRLYYVLRGEDSSYTVAFFAVEEQLSYDFRYRDEPLVIVTRYKVAADGQETEDWCWYFTMPVDDFACLYNAVATCKKIG